MYCVRLQQVQRPERVDLKVGVGIAGRPVVRRLRGSVNDDFRRLEPSSRKQRVDSAIVADIDVVVAIVLAANSGVGPASRLSRPQDRRSGARMSLSIPTTSKPSA